MMNAGSMKDFFYIFSFKHASDYVNDNNDDDEEQKMRGRKKFIK